MQPIAYVLALLVGAVVLFSLERLSVDLITLLLLIALLVPGIITPEEAFAGFSNDIIVILASIFVVSAGLKESGVLDWVGMQMQRFARVGSRGFLLTMMAAAGGVSAFMNNTTVMALFTPLVASLGRKGGVSPSKLLMPLAFASILGGTCTLIGTSTNVAVSGFIKQAGLTPIGMFEMTPIGLAILATGIAYMVAFGVRLLPAAAETDVTSAYEIREYLSEIVVLAQSPLIGQAINDSELALLDFRILKVIRGEREFPPDSRVLLAEGDLVIVTGKVANLMKVKRIEGLEIKGDWKLRAKELEGEELKVAEVLVGTHSEAAGSTIVEADIHRNFGVTVLAIYRQGRTLAEQLRRIRLQVGDVLLIQGAPGRFRALQEALDMPVLAEVPTAFLHPRRGIIVLAAFLVAIIAGSTGLLPLSTSFLIAAVATVMLGGVTLERAYQFIDWRLLILIGGMTGFGVAIDKTGTAAFLSDLVIRTFGGLGAHGILAAFFVLTIALTQPMSNAAAALVVLPVAIKTAQALGSNPRTFAIGVMLAASVSFIAPFEPSCVLVYSPGRYRFADFVRVGSGLTLVLCVVVLAVLPIFWPL